MEAAEPWHGNDLRTHRRDRRCFVTRRSLFPQPEMRSVVVVIANVFGHEPFQVAFIEHDYMIEQIAPARADESFGHAILPGALERGTDRLHVKGLCGFYNLGVEGGVPIEDLVARRGIIGKRLAQLLRHPSTCWMASHVEMKNLTPVCRQNSIRPKLHQQLAVRGTNSEPIFGVYDGVSVRVRTCRRSRILKSSTKHTTVQRQTLLGTHNFAVN
jgi:hypothetical protein